MPGRTALAAVILLSACRPAPRALPAGLDPDRLAAAAESHFRLREGGPHLSQALSSWRLASRRRPADGALRLRLARALLEGLPYLPPRQRADAVRESVTLSWDLVSRGLEGARPLLVLGFLQLSRQARDPSVSGAWLTFAQRELDLLDPGAGDTRMQGRVWLLKGLALQQGWRLSGGSGQPPGAVDCFSKAVDLMPASLRSRESLAAAFLSDGQASRARREAARMLSLRSIMEDEVEARRLRGWARGVLRAGGSR